jgi:hypothetical protein
VATVERVCVRCSAAFTLTDEQQAHHLGRGWALPVRCLECRRQARLERKQS